MEWAEPEKKPMVSVVRSGRGVGPEVVSAASRGWLLEFPPPPFGPHPEISVQTRANESTRDNGATITEIQDLSRFYLATHIEKYKDGALDGIRDILKAQYPLSLIHI